jgi:hypothetical protein
MTRNTLVGEVLAGILFFGIPALADDPTKESSTDLHQPTGTVEASKQLGGISLTGGYSRFSGPAHLTASVFIDDAYAGRFENLSRWTRKDA